MYQDALRDECKQLVDQLRSHWPAIPDYIGTQRILKSAVQIIDSEVRPLLNSWAKNREYLSHIDRLQDKLMDVRVEKPLGIGCGLPHQPLHTKREKPRNITIGNLMAERLPECAYDLRLLQSFPLSKKKHHPQRVDKVHHLLDRLREGSPNNFQKDYLNHLEASLEEYEAHLSSICHTSAEINEEFIEILQEAALQHSKTYLLQTRWFLRPISIEEQLMQLAGVWPLVTTHTLLKCLSFGKRTSLSPSWNALVNNHATSIHDVKRMGRMLQFSRSGNQAALRSEIEYMRTWEPSQHPDWLLVEIEANISIRPVQAIVAGSMLNPEGARNSVIQLNMGEGKSSVIVPIVAASSSNGRNLCRVMVLGPQMKQQFQILRQTLTGLSNRRILYVPFGRKLHLDAHTVARVQELFHQGMKDGAIWICEPEHILSLKLLGLDQADRTGSHELINIQLWLHNHSKDILDESDEVLHTRQQVIYTTGCQQSLDAAPLRWEVIQKLLGHLSVYLAGEDRSQHFPSFLVDSNWRTSAFPIVHIESDDAPAELQKFFENSLHKNHWSIPSHMREPVMEFVTKVKPSDATIGQLDSYSSQEDGRVMQTVLILRAMIAYDILLQTLKGKRWRVDYGLDLQRSKLAVPFRAKDSPSPRSEFGHPDVIILLTCLSYYYRGLDAEMVTHTIQALLSEEARELVYADWLKECKVDVPMSLRTIEGIDLKDESLLHTQIVPLFKDNKAVIDLYLNTFIFPIYLKEFPSKMSSSGWDIAITKPTPTTGFSGTNDGRFLLPTTITQTDQPAQLHTNAKVLSYILGPENATVVRYPNFLSAACILHRIHDFPSRPKVILDVGAQILDLSNIEFAKIWLNMYKKDTTIAAAVCFDEKSNLLVLTRDGTTHPFIDSPYSSRLEECLIYLDEGHTRGTDLRIPVNTQAVVTLGPKLNKDKLVQGCMRMRKLGDGHSLVFMGPDEVINSIKNATGIHGEDITTEDVLLWSIKETWKQIQSNLPAWVIQGHCFVRREKAWNGLFRGERPSSEDMAEGFCDPESRTLEKLYGTQSSETDHWIWRQHSTNSKNEIVKKIVQKCQDFDSFILTSAVVDEEMEIELVHEKEVEREVERAPEAEPALHAMSARVQAFIETGNIRFGAGFRRAAEAFEHTSLVVPAGFDKVFPNLIVTEDFYRTIQIPSIHSGSMDNFMRSVNWVVTAPRGLRNPLMVLFSPYEVNHLLPKFRTSTKVKLHMFAPRTNPAVPSLEDLDFLTLPSTPVETRLPRSLAMQLNLFSGSLYFQDYQTYLDVCRVLRLHFGPLPSHLAKPEIINANFFVLDSKARMELGMGEYGFSVNALPFFQNMITMRRFGRGFGPSHMGKILYGASLEESDF